MHPIQAPRTRLHLRRLGFVVGFALALLLSISFTLAAISAAPRRFNPPSSPHGSTSSARPAALAEGLPVTSGRISSAQCAACHSVEPVLSHPTRILPTMTLPSGFPLDNGTLNCTTCHLDSPADHSSDSTATNPYLLRGTADTTTFCIQCHGDTARTRQARHPMALSRAHLGWRNLRYSLTTNTVAAANPYEDGFRNCLSCHDGTVASDAFMGVVTASTPSLTTSGMGVNGANHPVGMTYPVQPRLGERALTPPSMLDSRIHLASGQVNCTTCHSLYSPEKKLLVMSNRDSSLCTSCHTMQ